MYPLPLAGHGAGALFLRGIVMSQIGIVERVNVSRPVEQPAVARVADTEKVVEAAKPATIAATVEATDKAARAENAELERITSRLNRIMSERATQVRFEVDKQGKRLVISVVDMNTSEVLRQIPSEEALRINDYIDGIQGIALTSYA